MQNLVTGESEVEEAVLSGPAAAGDPRDRVQAETVTTRNTVNKIILIRIDVTDLLEVKKKGSSLVTVHRILPWFFVGPYNYSPCFLIVGKCSGRSTHDLPYSLMLKFPLYIFYVPLIFNPQEENGQDKVQISNRYDMYYQKCQILNL